MALDLKSLGMGVLLGGVVAVAALAIVASRIEDDGPSAVPVAASSALPAGHLPSLESDRYAPRAARRTYEIKGIPYTQSENAHGAVLTSQDDGKRIALGKGCDVVSDEFGPGRWEWSNAGFAIVFSGERFDFARMDAPIDTEHCEAQ